MIHYYRFASFEVAKSEEMYKELLESDSIIYSCHISSFTGRLKSVFCFLDDVDDIVKTEISNETLENVC